MRCKHCKASHEEYYEYGYEVDWYCMIGVHENDMNEDKQGEWGCNLNYKTINKKVEKIERLIEKDHEAQVEYFLKEKELESQEKEHP